MNYEALALEMLYTEDYPMDFVAQVVQAAKDDPVVQEICEQWLESETPAERAILSMELLGYVLPLEADHEDD